MGRCRWPHQEGAWPERAGRTPIQVVMRNTHSNKNAVYISKAVRPRLTHVKRVLKNAGLTGRERDQRERSLKWRWTGSWRGHRPVLSKGLQGAANRSETKTLETLETLGINTFPQERKGPGPSRSSSLLRCPPLTGPSPKHPRRLPPQAAMFYASSKFYFLIFNKLQKFFKWNFIFTLT